MTRRTWAVAILGAWAVSLGWLAKRALFRPTETRLAEAALSVPPGAVYYRLDVAGQQVGFASSTIDTQATSIGVTDMLVLRTPAIGVLHRTAVLSRAVLSRGLRLEGVLARFDGDVGRFTARSLVTGDSVLTVTLFAESDSQTTRVPLARPIVLPSLLPLRLAFGGELKRGKTYASVVFDPVLLAEHPVTVVVAAESTFVVADSAAYDSTALAWIPARFDTVRAFRIEQREGGMTTRAWIDAQGHIVRAENAVGFVMERTAFELAYTNFRHRDTTQVIRASAAPGPGDVVATTLLAARAPLPHDTLSLFRARLKGAGPGMLDLGGGRQELSGDTLVIHRETRAMLARYRLPASDSGLAQWLAPAPLIQSDDPRVQAQARLIVGREQDPASAARRIAVWVRAHLERRSTTAVPSAVRVLETRVGDTNEHAVLFVALARAAGLPARTVAGLVPVDGRFYYHAWAEVYLGDWVAVDPMLDDIPQGVLYGCLGPNGAGKTTTLRMIAGILRPTNGRVLLGGDDVHANPIPAKMRLGFIPDRPFVYDKLTGVEFLRFVAALYGQEGAAVDRRIAELLDVFELERWKDELVEAYSHGMRQKLIISSALIHRPQCIVVDEPMVGLDPKAARLLKDIFRQFVGRGGTVLMSTHTLEVAEAMCDRVAIIQHGKIVAEGTVDDLRRQHRAGDASLEELFLKLTGGAQIRDLVEVLGVGDNGGGSAA